ncbi:MAG: hypothetical protein ABEH43_10445 [Flavobacteriales bacterium]
MSFIKRNVEMNKYINTYSYYLSLSLRLFRIAYQMLSLKRILIANCIIVLFPISLISQSGDINKPNGKMNKKEIKDENKKSGKSEEVKEQINDYIEAGDKYFEKGPLSYNKALKAYENAKKLAPKNAEVNYKIAGIHWNKKRFEKALKYYKNAYKYDSTINPDIHKDLGLAYHRNGKLELAEKHLNDHISKYRKKIKSSLRDSLKETYRILKATRIAKKNRKKEVKVFVDNISKRLNSPYPDYDPFLSADGDKVYFTSRRKNTRSGNRADIDGFYYEDVFVSKRDSNGVWEEAKPLPKKINKRTNDAIVHLSLDGQIMLLYRDDDNGDLFMSKKQGHEWQRAKELDNINTKDHQESSATLSHDHKTLYFVSDRKGGQGGKDLYMSTRKENEEWSEPLNMGAKVNSPFNEARPFIHPDGKTLYFSSKGHGTMGGYDIFKTKKKENGNWSEPKNLGYPINSVLDDISFITSPSGKRGYYSTVPTKEGQGKKDIFLVKFLEVKKPGVINTENKLLAYRNQPVAEKVIESKVERKEANLTVLKGVIKDAETNKPLKAEIKIVDNKKNKVINKIESNSKTGEYLIPLPTGKKEGNYGISVKAPGYMFQSENIQTVASTRYNIVKKDIELKKMSKGNKVVLNNIFFDFDKSKLRDESIAELNRLVEMMKNRTDLKIEIQGHTDNQG